jgi:hypothetical protein
LYVEVAPAAAATANDVTYQWYADGEAIRHARADYYTLTADDFGKVITVEVKGRNGSAYAGATVTSNESGVVSAIGKLGVKRDGKTLDNESIVGVGNELTPVITAYRYDGDGYAREGYTPTHELVAIDVAGVEELATYAWTVGDAVVSEETSYTVMADDADNSWTCAASGIEPSEEGALTWGNGLKIVADAPVTVAGGLNDATRSTTYYSTTITGSYTVIPEEAVNGQQWYRTNGAGNIVAAGAGETQVLSNNAQREFYVAVSLNDGYEFADGVTTTITLQDGTEVEVLAEKYVNNGGTQAQQQDWEVVPANQ